MRTLDKKFGLLMIPLVVLATLFCMPKGARAQPNIPMELRGHVAPFIPDSVIAYNKRNGKRLAASAVPYHDTVSVPNRFLFQIPTDPEGVNGAIAGDTIGFYAMGGV